MTGNLRAKPQLARGAAINEKPESEKSPTTVASDFLEALHGDPLRVETMRSAHHLVIVSAITIAVVLFKVRLQPTSLIPLDFGERADTLPMLLSLAVLLLFLGFIARAIMDVLGDEETNVSCYSVHRA
jgi:hypothetical protein